MSTLHKPLEVITIMADYSAEPAVWRNGSLSDLEDICEEVGIEFSLDIQALALRLNAWQYIYEGFDFFSGRITSKTIHDTETFKDWDIEGRLLAIEVRKIIPMKYEVEYFSEEDSIRYTIYLME